MNTVQMDHPCGESLDTLAQRMARLAEERCVIVRSEHNEFALEAKPGMNARQIAQPWYDEQARREYERTGMAQRRKAALAELEAKVNAAMSCFDALTEWVEAKGKSVTCTECGRRKEPRGRSAPLATAGSMCDRDCSGYHKEPRADDLWPGESRFDFGFPVDWVQARVALNEMRAALAAWKEAR